MSELVATAVAKGVAKGVLYLKAWWHSNAAAAVAANLDTFLYSSMTTPYFVYAL